MGAAFWIRRFILVWTAAFVLIAGAQALKGHDLAYALTQGLLWATISAGVFLGARLYQSRRGQHCAICRDTPEMRGEGGLEADRNPVSSKPLQLASVQRLVLMPGTLAPDRDLGGLFVGDDRHVVATFGDQSLPVGQMVDVPGKFGLEIPH